MATRRRELDLPRWFPRRFFEAPETWFGFERMINVEEYVDDGQVVVKAELPGVDPEKDVDITVHDGMLDIRAERRQESKTEDKRGYRSEFRYGMFSRTLPLPAGADEEDVEANYKDGVLEVRLPVREEAAEEKVKKIPIRRA